MYRAVISRSWCELFFNSDVLCGNDSRTKTYNRKYLCVIIDELLTWRSQCHVDFLGCKIAQVLSQLWRHGKSLNIAACRTQYLRMIRARI